MRNDKINRKFKYFTIAKIFSEIGCIKYSFIEIHKNDKPIVYRKRKLDLPLIQRN